MPPKRIANQDNKAHLSWKKIKETSSDDNSTIDCTDKERGLLDYMLERYQNWTVQYYSFKIEQNSPTKGFWWVDHQRKLGGSRPNNWGKETEDNEEKLSKCWQLIL